MEGVEYSNTVLVCGMCCYVAFAVVMMGGQRRID